MSDIRTERRQDYINYIKMLEIFSECVEAVRGKNISNDLAWLCDAEILALKFFFHLGSAFKLQEGTSLPPIAGVAPNYVDFPSIALLTRAALETYLCFNFIYIQPSTMKEKAFRHDIWELGGFLERQKFTATTAEGRQKIQEEKEVIKELKEKLDQTLFLILCLSQEKRMPSRGSGG